MQPERVKDRFRRAYAASESSMGNQKEGKVMFEGKKYIYEVYKTRSFSRAAENLYIAQPSLSAIVKKIEKKIGAPIFDRSTTPLQLTECGEQYIRFIERLMDMENEFGNYLNDLEGLHTGHLSIGGTNLFASYILPPLLTKFMKACPSIGIDLVESNTKSLEKQLLSGSLDLVIDNYTFPKSACDRHLFRTEHLLLAVPQALAAAHAAELSGCIMSASDIRRSLHLEETRKPVSLKIFANDPFLLLRPGNDTRERSNVLLGKAGISRPNVLLSLDQQITAYHLACYGMGIAFVTDTLIKHVPADRRILFLKPEGTETERNIYFYYKRTRYMTRAMQEFLRQI